MGASERLLFELCGGALRKWRRGNASTTVHRLAWRSGAGLFLHHECHSISFSGLDGISFGIRYIRICSHAPFIAGHPRLYDQD